MGSQISRKVLRDWDSDATEGRLPTELQLVFALALKPGIAHPQRALRGERDPAQLPLILLAGANDPESSLYRLKAFKTTLLPMIYRHIRRGLQGCVEKKASALYWTSVVFPP